MHIRVSSVTITFVLSFGEETFIQASISALDFHLSAEKLTGLADVLLRTEPYGGDDGPEPAPAHLEPQSQA
jgi:hypothetical protein